MTRETGTSHLLADLQGGVLTLTLNRAEARNALSGAMLIALAEQLHMAELDPAVKCIVLTGAGTAFCAGGDLKGDDSSSARKPLTVDERIHEQRHYQRATAGRLFRMPKPTLAALSGPAAGAGLSLALACDLRIMARPAFFAAAFAKVGFSGDFGGMFFLTQLVGPSKARELYYLGEKVGAEEAVRLGLSNWICEPQELESKTIELAKRLADGPGIAMRYMKENGNRALSATLEECMDLEATHHVHCGMTEDHQEAVKAFIEKRSPIFNGR